MRWRGGGHRGGNARVKGELHSGLGKDEYTTAVLQVRRIGVGLAGVDELLGGSEVPQLEKNGSHSFNKAPNPN